MKKLRFPIILGLLGCGLLIWLTIWQIQRLAWKENLLANLTVQMESAPKTMADLPSLDLRKVDGLPFSARGKIGTEYVDLLSGGTGGAGYRRIAALDTGEHIIMIELGFLPEGQKLNAFEGSSSDVEITGNLYAPKGNGSYDQKRNIWVGYDLEKMAKQLGAEPIILVAKTSPFPEIISEPFTLNIPNNHLQYAITWALLALAWGAMTVYWGYSKIRTGK